MPAESKADHSLSAHQGERNASESNEVQEQQGCPSAPSVPLSGHSPSIVALACWHVATPSTWLHEPGRLYCSAHHSWQVSSVSSTFPDVPIGIVRQHPRDNGCERQVLLHFSRLVSRAEYGEYRFVLCSGRLQLYLSHWPSTAALMAVAIFIRYFPSVRLELHYDSASDSARA